LLFYAHHVPRHAVYVLFGALLFLACGGSSVDDSVVSDAQSEAPETLAVGSPLQEALGFPSEPGERQFQLIAEQAQANASIVDCMGQAGFFYAVDAAERRFRTAGYVGDGSREWVAANGLGVTASFLDVLTVDPVQDAATANLEYVTSLSPEQAAAYDLALVGEPDPESAAAEFQPGGCWSRSYGEFVQKLALIAEFDTKLGAMNARLQSDPRTRGFQTTWSACMDTAGYRYLDETALVDDLYARLLDVELVEANGVSQVATPEILDEIVAYEKQVGVASFDCQATYASELIALRHDYEFEFLEDNRFRIAELLPAPS